MNIKNQLSYSLDIVLQYHNSPLVFWLHAYRWKLVIFATFRPSWPWPSPWIRSHNILSCITHQPLPTLCPCCLFTKQYVACCEIGHFLCSVISQGKVVALDRWGGKWNHRSIRHRLTTNYAKNYCNRTLIVKVITDKKAQLMLANPRDAKRWSSSQVGNPVFIVIKFLIQITSTYNS